jgi:hypothetical protein
MRGSNQSPYSLPTLDRMAERLSEFMVEEFIQYKLGV